ncbi:MAG TPA: hypothetical protein VD735_06305 [Candidatus Saccharimonadales bacterium]|nr:hypothetical protein [Candidatus Saccharimonadales bacterium]
MPPRLPCFTEAQLRSPDGPNLPGLWAPARIDPADPYAFFRDTDWRPVLNLAIVTEAISESGQTSLRLLTGSRPESEQTHPNVVSTPTQWMTDRPRLELLLEQAFFAPHILGNTTTSAGLAVNPELHLGEINPSRFGVIANVEPHPVSIGGVTPPLGFFTQKLLADKLGFDSWYAPSPKEKLAATGLHPSIGSVSLSRLLAGFSYVGENEHDDPLYEPIVMVGGVMHTPFPKLFARSTPRYDNLTFTSLSAFPQNVRNREVGNLIQLDAEYNEIMMCVRGLCLTTGAEMSSGPDLLGHSNVIEVGAHYDAEAATVVAALLQARDDRGVALERGTQSILGYAPFSDRRVSFERDIVGDLLRASHTATASPDHAARTIGHLEDALATAGTGFAFHLPKR